MFDNIINLKNRRLCIDIFFLAIIIILCIYVFKQNKQMEHMTNTSETDVHKAVKEVYDLDVAAIRNLSNLAGQLKNENNLTIPGNLKVTGKLEVIDSTTLKNKLDVDGETTLKNKLDVDGETTLKNKLDVKDNIKTNNKQFETKIIKVPDFSDTDLGYSANDWVCFIGGKNLDFNNTDPGRIESYCFVKNNSWHIRSEVESSGDRAEYYIIAIPKTYFNSNKIENRRLTY